MRLSFLSLLCLATMLMSGCSTFTSASSTPTSVTTVAAAIQADTLVTKAIDAYVLNGMPNRATLIELKALNDGLHKAVDALEAANSAGQPQALAVFNAALAAYNSYAATVGVSH